MRRKTTTKKLQQAIKDDLLKLVKAEKYSKSTRKTTTISTEAFKDDFDFLCETIFSDAIGWHYEYDIKEKQYIIECGRMDGSVDFIFIAHLCACDGVERECINNALNVIED